MNASTLAGMAAQWSTLLQQVVESVGSTTQRMWPHVVHVFWVRNLLDLCLVPVLWGVLGGGILWLVRLAKRLQATEPACLKDSVMLCYVIAVILGVVLGVMTSVYFFALPTLVSAVLEPEAAYLMHILKLQ